MQVLKIEYMREDTRGLLTQVNTADWKQFNYLKIGSGQVFGGHYHKYKIELFYLVKGQLTAEVTNEKGKQNLLLIPGEGVVIEPYDNHTLFAHEDTDVIELLSEPYTKEDVYNG